MQIISKSAITSLLLVSSVFAVSPPTEGSPTNVTGALGDAKEYKSQSQDKTYAVQFSTKGLSGGITFNPTPDQGVKVVVAIYGLPDVGGPFSYHVHDQPVPSDGNCTGTKAHLDPFIRGQVIHCDPKRPESCEVGDLSGKHGKIPISSNGTYTSTYTDYYITLDQGVGAFIGNRSVVIHTNDTKRYACADIEVQEDHSSPGSKFQPGYLGCGLGFAAGLKFLLI